VFYYFGEYQEGLNKRGVFDERSVSTYSQSVTMLLRAENLVLFYFIE